MASPLHATVLDTSGGLWHSEVDRLRTLLGAPHNPALLPAHFLKVTLTRIGGRALQFELDGSRVGVGFLFPRALHGKTQVFTLRFHRFVPALPVDPGALCDAARKALGGAEVVFYDADGPHRFEPGSWRLDEADLGQPSAAEAQAIRVLQAQIWGSEPDLLYPADIHSPDFGSARSFVARVDGQPAAFLFSFFKFGGSPLPDAWQWRVRSDWRMESQTMGVDPAQRGRGLATALKSAQAEVARQAGIDVVNWTADPLQWPNAVLNLGRLRAVAFEFLPDYYAFRNELNRVAASRVALTWLVDSARVRTGIAEGCGVVANLASVGARKVNDGHEWESIDANAATLAVEIPHNWTALQAEDPEQAVRWRESTDRLFSQILGHQLGQYMLTGVAEEDARRYLIAERMTSSLLESLLAKGKYQDSSAQTPQYPVNQVSA